jgi:LPXTG-site transpeptidase (sortase) family protein
MKLFFSISLVLPCIFFQPKVEINNSIEIKSIGIKSPIYISYSVSTLKYGVIIDGNSLEGNNWIVYGHRFSRYGKDIAFLNLDRVRGGDEINLILNGVEYLYVVDEILEIEPDQLWSISQGSSRQITLVTCTPVLYPIKRLVVIAQLK